MNVSLQWHGPFSVRQASTCPYLLDPANTPLDNPGVYLWTIPFDGQEFVFYVGQTQRTLRERARDEWRTKDHFLHHIPDPVKLKQGIKAWAYQPIGGSKPRCNQKLWDTGPAYFVQCWESFLDQVHVYFAPMTLNPTVINEMENALAWSVCDYEEISGLEEQGERYFLTNDERSYRYSYIPCTITNTTPNGAPISFRGIGETITWPVSLLKNDPKATLSSIAL
jgi:hypothetical protein